MRHGNDSTSSLSLSPQLGIAVLSVVYQVWSKIPWRWFDYKPQEGAPSKALYWDIEDPNENDEDFAVLNQEYDYGNGYSEESEDDQGDGKTDEVEFYLEDDQMYDPDSVVLGEGLGYEPEFVVGEGMGDPSGFALGMGMGDAPAFGFGAVPVFGISRACSISPP